MTDLVAVASGRILKLTLAVVALAGLLGAFVITGTSPSTDSISADGTVKQKSTYTIKRERHKLSGTTPTPGIVPSKRCGMYTRSAILS